MSDLIDTTEMYLRTVLELEEEGIVPMRARIAERLGQSGPTVSQTVARMERDGLVQVGGDRRLQLTEQGHLRAVRVMRKHRLAERLLLDVIGLEWQYVHEEACRWEHVISDRVERKLLALLSDPEESPYGNPIPGLDELGGAVGVEFRDGVRSVTDVFGHAVGESAPMGEGAEGASAAASAAPVELMVRRLGERVQSDVPLLERLNSAGVRPGRRIQASLAAGRVTLQGEAGVVVLPLADAHHVFVEDRVGDRAVQPSALKVVGT